MLSMVMVAVLAFSFKVADSEKTVQTMSLPVSNKVIVLDARSWNTREGGELTALNKKY